MHIGQAAQEAGVGVETVRFYERKGLINQPQKPQDEGYRSYPCETVERIRFIRGAQDLGFSLKEIDSLLSLRADPAAECGDVRARAKTKLREVDDKIARLAAIKAALSRLIQTCPGQGPALDHCSILESLDPVSIDKSAPKKKSNSNDGREDQEAFE